MWLILKPWFGNLSKVRLDIVVKRTGFYPTIDHEEKLIWKKVPDYHYFRFVLPCPESGLRICPVPGTYPFWLLIFKRIFDSICEHNRQSNYRLQLNLYHGEIFRCWTQTRIHCRTFRAAQKCKTGSNEHWD